MSQSLGEPHHNISEDVTAVRHRFCQEFGGRPQWVIRAPGRINIIGEHIDYNGYPVLPMAIEQCILVAVSKNSDEKIRIVNYASKYPNFTCDVTKVSEISSSQPKWYDYVLCGIYGVQQELDLKELHGMNLMVWGKIPHSAGLSSSSALVCGAALATVTIQNCSSSSFKMTKENGLNGSKTSDGLEKNEENGSNTNGDEISSSQSKSRESGDNGDIMRKDDKSRHEITDMIENSRASSTDTVLNGDEIITASSDGISMKRLAQMCAAAEKHVGTQGGGMDQAACLLSKLGCAQLISFNPLKCEEVTLPKGATFVVANSLQNINKAATSDFNCRVMECRLACRVLISKINSAGSNMNPDEIPNLAFLQEKLGKSLSEMIALVEKNLHAEPYTVEEIAGILAITPEELRSTILSENTLHIESFKLRSRALHVFSEAKRVFAFKEICDNWKTKEDTATQEERDAVLSSLGDVMFASHLSTRDDYECSHPALDRLVELSRPHALGARLTGAGWGGCTVALVPETAVKAHCALLQEEYYHKVLTLDPGEVPLALFASPPSAGASVF